MYLDDLTEWDLVNLTSSVDHWAYILQFLILQMKKVHQDEVEATKKAAKATRTLAKSCPIPSHGPAPWTSSIPITLMTTITAHTTTSSPLPPTNPLLTVQ